MNTEIVHAGNFEGTAIPLRRYNYVSNKSKNLLDSNRTHLIRKTNVVNSTNDGELVIDQACEYLLGLFTNKWSEHASESEKHVLDRLYRKGHERAAQRLNHLIEIFADDEDKLAPESVEAFACFFLTNRPQYPGPGIFGDDEGHVGIQWRIPSSRSPDGDDLNSDGILFLEFVSPEQVSYFGDAEDISLEGEASLNEIMEAIKPFTKRLDW